MRNIPSIVDFSKPHLITLDGARYYVPIYQRAMARHQRGEDITVPAPGATPKVIERERGTYLSDEYDWTFKDGVATISMIGPIVRYGGFMSAYSGMCSLGKFMASFNQARTHESVKSLAFVFDSPGGDATSIPEAAQTIFKARGEKPMIAYVDGSCCSGAQWIAAACDETVMSDIGLAGSIGAVMAIEDDTALMESLGIKTYVFKSSKAPLKWAEPGSKEGGDVYQMIVDRMGETFGEAMAQFRGVPIDRVWSDFGQGAVVVGQDAVTCGLCDRMGDFESLHLELSKGYTPGRRSQFAMGAEGGAAKTQMANENEKKPLTVGAVLEFFGFSGQELVANTSAPAAPAAAAPAPAVALAAGASAAPGTMPNVHLPAAGPGPAVAGVSNVGAALAAAVAGAPDPRDAQIAALQQQLANLQSGADGHAVSAREQFVSLAQSRVPTYLHASLPAMFDAAEKGELSGADLQALFAAMPEQTVLSQINPKTGATRVATPAVKPSDARPNDQEGVATQSPDTGPSVSAERKAELLNKTAVGAAALAKHG